MGVNTFNGMNNVTDPLRLGLQWLARADNVNVTDTGGIVRRDGYTLAAAGVFTGAYATLDAERMYVVVDGEVRTADGVVLVSGVSDAPMMWAEINDQVFFSNGAVSGIIQADNSVLDWRWLEPAAPTISPVTGSLPSGVYSVCCTYVLADGRETGPGDVAAVVLGEGQAVSISDIPHVAGAATRVYIAPANSSVFQLAADSAGAALVWNFSSDALGQDLTTDGLSPLPQGVSCIQVHRGQVYAAQYMPSLGQTVVWASQPLGFHLFRLSTDFFLVPGEITMLAPVDTALVVGTTDRVFAYTGESLEEVADYGVVPGQHWARDGARILFWTARGVCSALPFTNLTEKSVSVAPGVKAGGAVVRQGGQKRYLVVLQQGGSAFNAFKETP